MIYHKIFRKDIIKYSLTVVMVRVTLRVSYSLGMLQIKPFFIFPELAVINIKVLFILGVAVNIPVYFPCIPVNTREQRVIPEPLQVIN